MLTQTLQTILVAALCVVGGTPARAQEPSPLLTQPVDKLIATLQSPAATHKAKADACRELAVIGGRQAVPALAALLPDEQMNHMARYALETMPDDAAGEALRTAVGQLSGRPLVGVIGSVGVRRDAKAVAPLTPRLRDADADVAQAAARALGSIGTPAAAKALEAVVTDVPAGNRLAVCEGLFRCAEALTAKGQKREATGIYDKLRTLPDAPHQVRAGALRGAILVRGKEGLPLLQQALRDQDYILTAAAARAALEMTGPEVTRALVTEAGQLTGDRKILVLQVLGRRGDAAGLPAVVAAAQGGDKAVRIAAVRVIPEIGRAAAVPPLVQLLGDGDAEIAKAAQEGLAALPDADADKAVMALLASDKPAERLAGIDLVGRRRMTACVPALLKAAGDSDASVRPAALKRAGELGTAAELPALLDLLVKAGSTPDRDAAEQAVITVCAGAADPAACVAKVTALLPAASPETKGSLLRVLTSAGGPDALKAVRAAVGDSDAGVRGAAIRALGAWKTAEVAPELLALAQAAGNPTEKTVLLRGYFGWASNPELPADRRLAMCQQAAGVVQQTEEKKLLLGALGSIKTAEALAVVTPYVEDAAVKEEAGAAVVGIAEELLKGGQAAQVAPKLVGPLQKVGQTTGNADLARKAKALTEQAQKK